MGEAGAMSRRGDESIRPSEKNFGNDPSSLPTASVARRVRRVWSYAGGLWPGLCSGMHLLLRGWVYTVCVQAEQPFFHFRASRGHLLHARHKGPDGRCVSEREKPDQTDEDRPPLGAQKYWQGIVRALRAWRQHRISWRTSS